jgi:hypothetical protein
MLYVSASPSTSLAASAIVTAVSSGTATAPLAAIGGSFTGVTEMLTLAILESSVPSLAL